jgi:hypothetical protein
MSAEKEAGDVMSEMIAYCGLDCNECKAFKATQTKDVEWKKQIAKHWSDQGEVKFKPEDVDCHGCKSDVISGFCLKLCEIRPCAEEKKVKTCAHCDDYQCEKLKEYLSTDPVAARNLEKIRKARALLNLIEDNSTNVNRLGISSLICVKRKGRKENKRNEKKNG